ncbi:cupin domain-containing protein [Oxalobacteraceae bacterium OM1]|nr:cupin domain-containing protein [Oxalobacteraceae bacterium OM1]
MSTHLAGSGEPIDVRPLGSQLPQAVSTALLRTDDLEVMRLVLAGGKQIPEHQVAGEITLQCLEGEIEVRSEGKAQALAAGQLLFLQGRVPYSIEARSDASVLMTVLRKEEAHKDVNENG